jgi:hypothetical protein
MQNNNNNNNNNEQKHGSIFKARPGKLENFITKCSNTEECDEQMMKTKEK